MLRRIQPVLLMSSVAAGFFLTGVMSESWLETPVHADMLSHAVASPVTRPVALQPTAPVAEQITPPAAIPEIRNEPIIETGIDPETGVEFLTMKDMPVIDGEGQAHDVDMVDDPAANEATATTSAEPSAKDQPALPADKPAD